MADAVIQRIHHLRQRLEALPLRQRVLAALVPLVLIGALGDLLVLTPQRERIEALETRIEEQQARLDELAAARDRLAEVVAANRTDALEAERARLESRIDTLDERLESAATGLVSPRAMATALRGLFADSPLTLTALEASAPERLRPDGAPESGEPAESAPAEDLPVLYRHRLTLTFEGRFADTLRYLERVRAREWDFYWDELTIATDEYPRAVVTWKLHTLSLEEGLIGV